MIDHLLQCWATFYLLNRKNIFSTVAEIAEFCMTFILYQFSTWFLDRLYDQPLMRSYEDLGNVRVFTLKIG